MNEKEYMYEAIDRIERSKRRSLLYTVFMVILLLGIVGAIAYYSVRNIRIKESEKAQVSMENVEIKRQISDVKGILEESKSNINQSKESLIDSLYRVVNVSDVRHVYAKGDLLIRGSSDLDTTQKNVIGAGQVMGAAIYGDTLVLMYEKGSSKPFDVPVIVANNGLSHTLKIRGSYVPVKSGSTVGYVYSGFIGELPIDTSANDLKDYYDYLKKDAEHDFKFGPLYRDFPEGKQTLSLKNTNMRECFFVLRDIYDKHNDFVFSDKVSDDGRGGSLWRFESDHHIVQIEMRDLSKRVFVEVTKKPGAH